MSSSSRKSAPRANLRNPVIAFLLAGILLALVILIGVVIAGRLGGPTPSAPSGQTENGTRIVPTNKPKPPKPIGNPDRIKQVLQKGKTYRVVLKAGVEARVEDKAYTVKTVVNMAYVAEFLIKRTIESNDGKRIVELRTFESCRTVKLESHVDELKIEWGLPGDLTLASLEFLAPGTAETILLVKPFVESILQQGADLAAKNNVQAFRRVDGLSGKKVRITYEDGIGVTEVTPVDCQLSQEETDFVWNTAVLSDGYLFPDLQIKSGGSWTVDASQLISFVDPSLRGIPSGSVTVQRGAGQNVEGKELAELLILEGSVVRLDSSDASTGRIGSFTPHGKLNFNITDGFVEQAELRADFAIDQVSKDHLLFETTMRSTPKLTMKYHCQIE